MRATTPLAAIEPGRPRIKVDEMLPLAAQKARNA